MHTDVWARPHVKMRLKFFLSSDSPSPPKLNTLHQRIVRYLYLGVKEGL